MLDSLLPEPKTAKNKEYMRLAKKACRLGIVAWGTSITAWQNDIVRYKGVIESIV
jgi:hypothetical protein